MTRTMTTSMTIDRAQSGVALLMVLLAFTAVAALAGAFARAMREEAESARNFKLATQAHYIALAGLNEAILATQYDRSQPGRAGRSGEEEVVVRAIDTLLVADGTWVESSFNGYAYEVRAVDEGGKVSLNTADGPLLHTVLLNLGYSEDVAATVADSVMDWRDEDDLHRLNGAEDQHYSSLPRPYRAKNADFDAIEELLLVRGVTREIFYGSAERGGLREIFSVFNDAKSVNLRSIMSPAIAGLSGIGVAEAKDLTTLRADASQSVPEELRLTLEGSGVGTRTGTPVVMTIEARVKGRDENVIAHLGAVVRVPPRGDGFRTYRWYDSVLVPEEG